MLATLSTIVRTLGQDLFWIRLAKARVGCYGDEGVGKAMPEGLFPVTAAMHWEVEGVVIDGCMRQDHKSLGRSSHGHKRRLTLPWIALDAPKLTN